VEYAEYALGGTYALRPRTLARGLPYVGGVRARGGREYTLRARRTEYALAGGMPRVERTGFCLPSERLV
jgi:hypothetical protein